MIIDPSSPLFSVENTFSGPIITLNRPVHALDVSLSDVEHTEHRIQGAAYKQVSVWQFGDLHLGLIKQFAALMRLNTLQTNHPAHHSVIYEVLPSLKRMNKGYAPLPYFVDKVTVLNYSGVIGTETHFQIVDDAINTLLDSCLGLPDIFIDRLVYMINSNIKSAIRILNDITETQARKSLIEGDVSDQLSKDALIPHAIFFNEAENDISDIEHRIEVLEYELANKIKNTLDVKLKLVHDHLMRTEGKQSIDMIRRVNKEN